MLAPVLVFFGVAGLVIGIYFGATRFFAAMDGRKLAQRLREVGHSPDVARRGPGHGPARRDRCRGLTAWSIEPGWVRACHG